MQQFTPQGQQFIQDLAQRYHVSSDAVVNMVYAVMNGNGTMAQFSHPDLGGSGQSLRKPPNDPPVGGFDLPQVVQKPIVLRVPQPAQIHVPDASAYLAGSVPVCGGFFFSEILLLSTASISA